MGLFLSAFLAGTVIAFGSEAVLVGALLLGTPPSTAVAVASVGNILGALTVYAIGRAIVGREKTRGWILDRPWLARLRQVDPERLARARKAIDRWGPIVLLLSWLPVVGDLLVLAAGLTRLGIGRVTLFVSAGKVARYSALAWAVGAVS